jgi:hypothetical protein
LCGRIPQPLGAHLVLVIVTPLSSQTMNNESDLLLGSL